MSFSHSLIVHAMQLAAIEHSGDKAAEMQNVSERRAVSAAYYALFHHLNQAAVGLIAPNVSIETSHRIQRGFEHTEIKSALVL